MDVQPFDAELALAEMHARREQVVDTSLVPRWFWPAIGGLLLLFVGAMEIGAMEIGAMETGFGWVTAVGTMVYTLATAAVILAVVRKARARVRFELLGARGIAVILGFAAGLTAIGVTLGLLLAAVSAPFPALLAAVPVAAGLTVGGPLLMSHLRRLMLSRPLAGSR